MDSNSLENWIGNRVLIGGVKSGVLRYFGRTYFAEGIWCGVELDEPIGKNNGKVKGIRYFSCKEQHGIFAPAAKVVKVESDKCTIDNEPENFDVAKCNVFLPSSSALQKAGIFLGDIENSNSNVFSDTVMEISEIQENRIERNESETLTENLNENIFMDIKESSIGTDYLNNEETMISKNNYDVETVVINKNENFIVHSTSNTCSNKMSDRQLPFVLDIVANKSCKYKQMEENDNEDDDLKSFEQDASLGILSPDEMEDFAMVSVSENLQSNCTLSPESQLSSQLIQVTCNSSGSDNSPVSIMSNITISPNMNINNSEPQKPKSPNINENELKNKINIEIIDIAQNFPDDIQNLTQPDYRSEENVPFDALTKSKILVINQDIKELGSEEGYILGRTYSTETLKKLLQQKSGSLQDIHSLPKESPTEEDRSEASMYEENSFKTLSKKVFRKEVVKKVRSKLRETSPVLPGIPNKDSRTIEHCQTKCRKTTVVSSLRSLKTKALSCDKLNKTKTVTSKIPISNKKDASISCSNSQYPSDMASKRTSTPVSEQKQKMASTPSNSQVSSQPKKNHPQNKSTSKGSNTVASPKAISKVSTKERCSLEKGTSKRVPPQRGSPSSNIKSTPSPPKFVSKTELVKRIQELESQCEVRKMQLTTMKSDLRHATLGFSALAVMSQYLAHEYDAFSNPSLRSECERSRIQLSTALDLVQSYKYELDNIWHTHNEQLAELAQKLEEVHVHEINELKSSHNIELQEVENSHKKQVNRLKDMFRTEAQENEEFHVQMLKSLQDRYEKEKVELKHSHYRKVQELEKQHRQVFEDLQEQLHETTMKCESLENQLKEFEEAFMKDKNSKLQRISAKKNDLEKEVDSLKAVLDMKSVEIQNLNKEKLEMKGKLDELASVREKIRQLERKNEDLQALMKEKVRIQHELSTEKEQLASQYEQETRVNKRLSMENETLQWRLQQSMELSLRSPSISASMESSLEDDRNNSRLSLPILESERQRKCHDNVRGSSSRTNREERGYSMSFSWHPLLPHNEESSQDGGETIPSNSRARKGRFKSYIHPGSKLSTLKAKKDIEIEVKRKSSLNRTNVRQGQPLSMSWQGGDLSHYYEVLDEVDLNTNMDKSKHDHEEEDPSEAKKSKKSNDLFDTGLHPDNDVDTEKSLSGIHSLQSSYTSESSNSFMPVQQGSEESSCSTKSNDSDSKDTSVGSVPGCGPWVKSPRNLAGEAMIHDEDNFQPLPNQSPKCPLKPNTSGTSVQGQSSSPVEVSKPYKNHDNNNHMSIATTSLDTSSQGMTDSMNLDVSWGDEDVLSDKE